ncbi:PREDICTED: mitochondrial import inner membrane translocase subunit TIM8-like [Fragaria vesca subsp. vesca]|uniref:mitochondrial import inner membrane translocase subunit TIM8-like n=1 Tax=Fragaria vesca subsp. vesca TaxID=101020 RepID=UPI0002C3576A|nr:PREDICTED: mitochondrial import inner membrane translocase subunit TIM8-like [Fragaria vesca subsp. vesca]
MDHHSLGAMDQHHSLKFTAMSEVIDKAHTDASNHEMINIISVEHHRVVVAEMVDRLTSACWDKCITSTTLGSKLSSSETACLSKCVRRYRDLGLIVEKHLPYDQPELLPNGKM